jgi:hypothetical protein
VKAVLFTLHFGLMTEGGINTISKEGIFIFSTATIFWVLPVLLLKLKLTFLEVMTVTFRMCVFVYLSIIWHVT